MTETGRDSPDKARESGCPFCGVKEAQSSVIVPLNYTVAFGVKWFECKTIKDSKIRGTDCYETEITRLKGLVREMGFHLREVLEFGIKQKPHKNITSVKAKAFLESPEVRAILEEK